MGKTLEEITEEALKLYDEDVDTSEIAVRTGSPTYLRLTALPGGHRLLNVAGNDRADVLGPVREESTCP